MPDWTLAELMLALEVYLSHGKAIDDRHEDVLRLSDFLSELDVIPLEERPPQFRNPNGVAAKLQNFARFDTRSSASRAHGGKLERPLWEAFSRRPDLLTEICDQLRKRAKAGAKAL